MTVKELISKLSEQDPDALVLVYCELSEDADFAHDVQPALTVESRRPEDRPYVKGDWPDCGKDGKYERQSPIGGKVVIIT